MGKGKDKKGKGKKKGKDNGHTDSVPESLIMNQVKVFEVDWDKVQSLEDIKLIFKTLNLTVMFYEEEIPEHLTELYEKGFLVEKTQLKITKDEEDEDGEKRES